MADVEKAPHRGQGKFTAKGVQADQEARIAGVEDYLAGLIESGVLPAPEEDAEEPVVEA